MPRCPDGGGGCWSPCSPPAILAAALAESFRTLAAHGIRTAAFDGHVTDPHLDPVARTFPPNIPTTPSTPPACPEALHPDRRDSSWHGSVRAFDLE
jgi:hypothetical protein